MTSRPAWGFGLATVTDDGAILDIWYPAPALGAPDDDAVAPADLTAAERVDERAASASQVVRTVGDLDAPPADTADAYLRLHLLSHRLVRPHGLNLDGLFGVLPNVGLDRPRPVRGRGLRGDPAAPRGHRGAPTVLGVDKFPRMVDYVLPTGVRIADADRVRLGAHLAAGTTVMHEGFVNYNAGTLGTSMVEGRISAGVVVGDGSDIGGGASIMGTLSGGGRPVVSVGARSLLGANAGLGIPLGDDCVVEAGLYVTAGTKVTLVGFRATTTAASSRPASSAGADGVLFRRNSLTGGVEAVARTGAGSSSTPHCTPTDHGARRRATRRRAGCAVVGHRGPARGRGRRRRRCWTTRARRARRPRCASPGGRRRRLALTPRPGAERGADRRRTIRRGLPARAATIALATAMQESRLVNIDYGDRDSVGLFQQRPSQGWGTVEQIMDPVYATGKFSTTWSRSTGYQDLPVTEAAQAVQRSGFPDAYAQHEPRARAFASALTGVTRRPALRPARPGRPAPATPPRSARACGATSASSPRPRPTPDGGASLTIDATALGGEADRARLDWAVAQWAVATASDLGSPSRSRWPTSVGPRGRRVGSPGRRRSGRATVRLRRRPATAEAGLSERRCPRSRAVVAPV